MELFKTDDFYIFVKGEHSLWWDRQTSALIPKAGWELTNADDPVCLGVCYGIIGKVYHPAVFYPRLLLIKKCTPVGKIHGTHTLFKIKSVVFLESNLDDPDLGLDKCSKHLSDTNEKNKGSNFFDIQKNPTFSKTWGTLKSAGNSIKNSTQQAAAIATGTPKKKDPKDREKFEKRIIDEFYKIFCDTDSFYFCETCDITNSLQRLCCIEKDTDLKTSALWKIADDKFFWNKYMLRDLIDLNNPFGDPWILPIIQGFVQIENCKVLVHSDGAQLNYEIFTLTLISRRSRYRAGTRYKRRGVDENGECANYVETEQIVTFQQHEVSFVQVRGSVPIYWSQPGFKYRPPPRIDKGEEENQVAFAKHFAKEIAKYGPVCIINLIEQTGKERIVWEAYTNHVLQLNCPELVYCTFDFHEYCRGMHFENVSILVNAVTDILRDMGYCWRDSQGHICSQVGVFRVNCIDCLDRTNVVQTALGKAAMEIQFTKLGLIPPDGTMPDSLKKTFQLLWANNGDTISKQYAGTNALKGDYTRTGERKISGIMKDGMNSANRYYLSRFKDSTRQGTIDLMLGNGVSEESFTDFKPQEEEDNTITAEHVKLLIEDCKKFLLQNLELVLGAWGLINANPYMCDPNETEMDSILILTKESYFVAEYDDQVDRITKYETVPLSDITSLEFGVPESMTSLFKTTKNHYCIRINYKINDCDGYFHMFRSTNLRFFNNMTVIIKNVEEEIESLKSICETFLVALEIAKLPPVPFIQGQKLEKKKCNARNSGKTNSSIYLDVVGLPQITRNVSETQLMNLKNAGSKALSNVTQQFKKINRLGSPFMKSQKTSTFVIGGSKQTESSSESEDEAYENSIFQPKKEDMIEQGIELTETSKVYESPKTELKPDTFLPSVGIVMASSNADSNNEGYGNFDNPPVIQINSEELKQKAAKPPNALQLDRTHSHSSGEVNSDDAAIDPNLIFIANEKRSNSEQDLTLNISQSQSESALKTRFANITSPVANVTKDLVLSPFSKLAKGVQNIGSNLDPRKLSISGRGFTERDIEEHKKLQEKWKDCKTRLIAL
ncbi:phosphatidylinositide phosphatase SAC2 isoform X2 [Agrilus planipennis]|uniref:Phosphatidylinositide phosphatase SAC2 isoform X2 n=1 Tax=Agrilus planipennis TaxID=224129 RepID=A0A7F5REM3_AGRPL|nr:phosphatidylinositide phosphatase SAC2 isoform X2 [Agrilus planipennis]